MIQRLRYIFGHQRFEADLTRGVDLSIPLSFQGQNPNCYWAEPPCAMVIRSGSFVGSVAQGGVCDYHQLTITPHGNGTHTETVGHIIAEEVPVSEAAKQPLHSQLISVKPIQKGDSWVVSEEDVLRQLLPNSLEALIIRTLPNDQSKLTRQYSGTNPPFLAPTLGAKLYELGIKHLLVDLPSLDPESDGGKLAAHHGFFGTSHKIDRNRTVTELIFVPEQAQDGQYLLMIQLPPLCIDAAPSRPIIYPVATHQS